MARWLVSFAADALKRLVICNRIIQSDVQKTIGRSVSSFRITKRDISGTRRSRSPFGPFARLRPSIGGGLYLSTENRISISRTSELNPPSFGRCLCALFLPGHIRTYKIFREFFRKSLERARPRSDRASIEIEEEEEKKQRDGRERIIAGLSESRDQRAMFAIFSDCYYPTGHFIALKSTYRATAILLPRSLNRTKSSLSERRREREREKL